MSFPSFRVSVRNLLGFETFVSHSLDDELSWYAFMVPSGIDPEVSIAIREFLKVCFSNAGMSCKKVSWVPNAVYEVGWCGSRCERILLEGHWLFEIIPDIATSLPLPPVPKEQWVVVEVDYDKYKGNRPTILCNAYYIAAATPKTYMTEHTRIVSLVKQKIAELYP